MTRTGDERGYENYNFRLIICRWHGFTFDSREKCVKMTPLVINHFARWGLEVHVGTQEKESKSKILLCVKDPRCYTNRANYDGTDLSPMRWEGGFQIAAVDKLKYRLGMNVSRKCRDNFDVDNRISSSGKDVGSLRKCIFSSRNISTLTKTYNTFIHNPFYPSLWQWMLVTNSKSIRPT